MTCKQLENTMAITKCIRHCSKESSLESTMKSILSEIDVNVESRKRRTTEHSFVARFFA